MNAQHSDEGDARGMERAWWRGVDEALDDLPDPWVDAVPETRSLSDEQREYLTGFADQPPTPRMKGELTSADEQLEPKPPPDAATPGP